MPEPEQQVKNQIGSFSTMLFAFRALIIIQLYQALFFRREKTVTRLFAQQELSVSDHPDIYYHFCN